MLRPHVVEALDLLTPVWCAGCGSAGTAVCDECGAAFFGPLRRADHDAPVLADAGPATWAAAQYAGPARDLVLAWKRGRRDVGPLFRQVGLQLADRWAAVAGSERLATAANVTVVPAPSGWVRRARGRLVALDLADAVAAGLRGAVTGPVVVSDCLRRPGVGHLAGKSARGRSSARRAFTVVRRLAPGPCVVVDDVVTSGSTIRAAARALGAQEGVEVVAALAVAATPARSATPRAAS